MTDIDLAVFQLFDGPPTCSMPVDPFDDRIDPFTMSMGANRPDFVYSDGFRNTKDGNCESSVIDVTTIGFVSDVSATAASKHDIGSDMSVVVGPCTSEAADSGYACFGLPAYCPPNVDFYESQANQFDFQPTAPAPVAQNPHQPQMQAAQTAERTFSADSVDSVYSEADSAQAASPDPDAEGAGSDTGAGPKPGSRFRKRPTFWTKEEHDKFLQGLQRFGNIEGTSLGAGVAELISIFIGTRSVPQVRSHAQKFFLRMKKQR